MDYLTDINGNVIDGILAEFVDNDSVIQIETRMLDGSYTVQSIGGPATTADVVFWTSNALRRSLQAKHAAGAQIKAYWRGQVYTGLISGNSIVWQEGLLGIDRLAEKVSFRLLVTEVV